MHVPVRSALALTVALGAASGTAEEGMWLFNDLPSEAVRKAYGFSPDAAWLDQVP